MRKHQKQLQNIFFQKKKNIRKHWKQSEKHQNNIRKHKKYSRNTQEIYKKKKIQKIIENKNKNIRHTTIKHIRKTVEAT